jgi:hypothetical protein
MNLLRKCIVTVVVVSALAPAAGADSWFGDRAADASSPTVIAGDRPGEFARIQATRPISGDRHGEDAARIQVTRLISGDRPADRVANPVVITSATQSGTSFDWVSAGVGAAFAFALVGLAIAGVALAARHGRLARPA